MQFMQLLPWGQTDVLPEVKTGPSFNCTINAFNLSYTKLVFNRNW